MVGVRQDRAEQLVADGQEATLIKEVLARYRAIAAQSDFVLRGVRLVVSGGTAIAADGDHSAVACAT